MADQGAALCGAVGSGGVLLLSIVGMFLSLFVVGEAASDMPGTTVEPAPGGDGED